jgi:hypothetical protein
MSPLNVRESESVSGPKLSLDRGLTDAEIEQLKQTTEVLEATESMPSHIPVNDPPPPVRRP